MPHIFPRRLLRRRDILTPKDMNEDVDPVSNVLAGKLDHTNFMSQNLKDNLRSTTSDSTTSGPAVANGAYFKCYSDNVETSPPFWQVFNPTDAPSISTIRQPNFVELEGTVGSDGSGLRDDHLYTGSNPRAYPFVVPNNGAWSVVKNADLSADQQITFSTGRSKVWISAYAQYIWQGFYEYKPPWIVGYRKYKDSPDVTFPNEGESWMGTHEEDLPLFERDVLNAFGPSDSWEYLASPSNPSTDEYIRTEQYQFSFPLNETNMVAERRSPDTNGFHHISRGCFPCLIQFALRVDGKIVEESITGKYLPFEESAHGLTVCDSPPIHGAETPEAGSEESAPIPSNYPGLTSLLGTFSEVGTTFGQRSVSTSSGYGDRGDSRPGQKVRSSRAVGYGPEVMPVRIGAVVDLQPGEHTIELVVRRLQRKKGSFPPGDFVGVFSRRLLAFDLPITSSRREPDFRVVEDSSATVSRLEPRNRPTTHFKSETPIEMSTLSGERLILANRVNSIDSTSLSDNTFSNEFLPSKVVYSETKTLTSLQRTNSHTGVFDGKSAFFVLGNSSRSTAIFPGMADTTDLTRVKGWSRVSNYTPTSSGVSDQSGWNMIGLNSDQELFISSSNLTVDPGEKLILHLDVELLGIDPIYSAAANELLLGPDGPDTDAETLKKNHAYFTQGLMAERYLDLFAFFALGYRSSTGSWTIGSNFAPAVVNSFNWVNRNSAYNLSPSPTLPINHNNASGSDPWSVNPGWHNVGGTSDELLKFYRGPAATSEEETESISFDPFTDYNPGVRDIVIVGGIPLSYSRGGNLNPNNLGVNIPIMQVIENTTTAAISIDQIAGFVASLAPSDWLSGSDQHNPRSEMLDGHSTELRYTWATPGSGGRNILDGVVVRTGSSRLSAIKISE
jgi:hypothetical protein